MILDVTTATVENPNLIIYALGSFGALASAVSGVSLTLYKTLKSQSEQKDTIIAAKEAELKEYRDVIKGLNDNVLLKRELDEFKERELSLYKIYIEKCEGVMSLVEVLENHQSKK